MRKQLWGFLTFFCGLLAFAGFNAFNRDFVADPGSAFLNLILGIIFIPLTILCALKLFGKRKEKRTYHPGDPLPLSVCPGLMLEQGEIGYLCEKVQIGKVKNVSTGSVTTHSGGSVRIARGLSVHSGTSYTRARRADILDRSAGTLYVTNKRIVGASPKYSFSQSHSSLTSIKRYADGFALQFGNKNYTILVDDPNYVSTILLIVNRAGISKPAAAKQPQPRDKAGRFVKTQSR